MRILTIFGLVILTLVLMGEKCPDEKQVADAAVASEEPKAPIEIVEVTDGGKAATEPAAKPTEPPKAEGDVKVGPVTAKEVIPATEVKKEEKLKKEEKKEEKAK